MNALIVLLTILIVLILLGRLRVGVRACYQEGGPLIRLKIGRFSKQIYPAAPKKEKAEKKQDKKHKADKPAPQPKTVREKAGGALEYAQELLPVVLETAAHFKRKLRIDLLRIKLTAGGKDPADAAMLYGQSMALLGTIWYPLTQSFNVKDGSAKVDLDFNAEKTTVFADAALTLKIGQILWLALYFGLKGLRAFMAVRSHQKKQIRKAA